MAKLLKLRRGTTSQHSSFTGAEGEVTVDTDKETLVVHNGSSAGGFPLARESALTSKADLASPDFTTDITLKSQAPVKFEDDSGGETVSLKAPTGVTTYEVTLPATAPSTGQVLKATSATALGWSSDSVVGGATGVDFNDSVKARFGTGNDFEIYHDGTDAILNDAGDGDLYYARGGTKKTKFSENGSITVLGDNQWIGIAPSGTAAKVYLGHTTYGGGNTTQGYIQSDTDNFKIEQANDSTSETYIACYDDAEVALYYDNAIKIQTASDGALIKGNANLEGSVVFEGSTADAHETTLAVVDATADRTITLPNATGTVGLLQEDQNWTGSQRGAINALTSASTITIDMNAGNNHSVTLGHNTTFANPTNQTAGQAGSIFITQDGTGSRTAAWGSNFLWKGGTVPTLSTTAAAVDRIDYIILASTKIHAVATLDIKAAS